MRPLLSIRWLAAATLVGLLAFGALIGTAKAAPQEQGDPTLTIFAIGFSDTVGGSDPSCPGCDGDYSSEDEEFAGNNPLGTLTFRVLDDTGTEIASASTMSLVSLERAMIDVPDLQDGESYTLELVSVSNGYQLCPNQSASRTLTLADFQLGSSRQDFYFYQGCPDQGATATPGAPATDVPPGPTNTPDPNQPTDPAPPPTDEPGDPDPVTPPGDDDDDDDDDDGDDDDDDGDNGDSGDSGSSSSSGSSPDGLTTIHVMAYMDDNGNGSRDAGEGDINDVGVHVQGGGLQLYKTTTGNGSAEFCCLGKGEYHVFISVGDEWHHTTPDRVITKVTGGRAEVHFGLNMTGKASDAPASSDKVIGGAMRLPATGIADLPTGGLLGAVILALGLVAGFGYAYERRERHS